MLAFALPLLLIAASADDVPEGLVNARVQTHSAAPGLAAVFRGLAREAGPAWIGYAVPALGHHRMCCYRSMEDMVAPGCNVENEGSFNRTINHSTKTGSWKTANDFLVLFRVEGGRVDRIRSLSRGCGIDVGGRPFHWITGVRPAESLALLESMVGSGAGASRKKDKGGMDEQPAIASIAMHADPGADAVLDRLVAAGQPLGVRKQAAFWLGTNRGRHGYETLRRLVADDASRELREHAVFGLSQNDVPEAVDVMIAVGRGDEDPHVRGHALFWLSQKAGRKAASAITRAIAEDPETAVKKKAVFALSQLPRDEGVPLLIGLARENANPVVRKQAMFWLGQSEDPRALAFFEEILAR